MEYPLGSSDGAKILRLRFAPLRMTGLIMTWAITIIYLAISWYGDYNTRINR